MSRIKIGYLPLYIELYDLTSPEMRPKIEAFNQIISNRLKEDYEVCEAPICRIKPEFEDAIKMFEKEKVEVIVTLHLDYSPSLESSEALASTDIPIVVLDTTREYDFGPTQSVDEIMFNHGIHGVQDMCNLLKRNKKQYFVEAGHWKYSDVFDRVASCIRSISTANAFRNARVGIVGEPFEGMGDFAVPFDRMKKDIGVEIIPFDFEWSENELEKVSEEEIQNDYEFCKQNYDVRDIKDDVWNRSARTNLVLRKWIEKENLTACTVNFLETENNAGLPVMPFLEISRQMAKGVGYAGEGDALTAAFVGALLHVYPETSFTEMFCPDWKNNSIMLSHMGEINVDLTAERALVVEKDWTFTNAPNPVTAYGRFKAGRAVLVDLAPSGEGEYTLIVAPVEVLSVEGQDNMAWSIHGWFRPVNCDISKFLSEYSFAGGTHHLAMVYGNVEKEIEMFGKLMHFDVVSI